MKKIIKTFNNYRLTALIFSIVNLVVAGFAIGLSFIYYFAGDINEITHSRMPSFYNYGDAHGLPGRYLGMAFFLLLLVMLVTSILEIYNLFPAILNKEKVNPSKTPLIIGVVTGGVELAVFVFCILAVTLETPHTFGSYVFAMIFVLLTAIVNLLGLFPIIKCNFYMPEIKRNKK